MCLTLKLGCLSFISGHLFVTMFVGVLALAGAYPIHPVTPLGWALWFVLALPIAILLSWIGDTAFGDRIGRKIDASARRAPRDEMAIASWSCSWTRTRF